MEFIYYDLILLVCFAMFISIFLYTKRENLKKDGLLFLYRAQWGMKLIDSVGKKYPKTLGVLSYLCVGLGYFLMGISIWLVGRIVWIYVAMPSVVKAIKVPPITPLVPYVDKFVPGLPTFYFTYWILIIALVAITHEFAHGIFMRKYGIKIKSTGFGFFPFFLPVFLAAFVEQDEKSMNNAKNFEQRAVLGAGTFANFVTGVLFFLIMVWFFSFSFAPSGISFDDYGYSIIEVNSLPENLTELDFTNGPLEINGSEFAGIKAIDVENGLIALYYNSPALRNNLSGAIVQIDDEKISEYDDLASYLNGKSVGEEIVVKTVGSNGTKEFSLVLDENPVDSERVWMGIVIQDVDDSGFLRSLISYKKENIYYEENFQGAEIIYNFLWWLVIICFSVAIINMLPVGIFDGGRFFYLTVLSLTGNKKVAEKSFKYVTLLFLFLLFVVMAYWGISFFR